MTEDEIRIRISNGHYVSWRRVSKNVSLSEEFIRQYQNNLSWFRISWHQILSEEFIEEFKDKVSWFGIGASQKLSEDFIRKHLSDLDPYHLSSTQKLSIEFINKFERLLYLGMIPFCYIDNNHKCYWKTFL